MLSGASTAPAGNPASGGESSCHPLYYVSSDSSGPFVGARVPLRQESSITITVTVAITIAVAIAIAIAIITILISITPS